MRHIYLGFQLCLVRFQHGYFLGVIVDRMVQPVIFPPEFGEFFLDQVVSAGAGHHFGPVSLQLIPGGVGTSLGSLQVRFQLGDPQDNPVCAYNCWENAVLLQKIVSSEYNTWVHLTRQDLSFLTNLVFFDKTCFFQQDLFFYCVLKKTILVENNKIC